jgi:hypothetical protein
LAQGAAAATHVPFSATLSLGTPGPPDRIWQGGPMLHVRGEPNAGTVEGDLVGDAALVNNYNLDTRTGEGVNWGTFVITTGDATWAGTFRGTIRDGANDGTFTGHGDDGSLLIGSFTQVVGFVFDLDGEIRGHD